MSVSRAVWDCVPFAAAIVARRKAALAAVPAQGPDPTQYATVPFRAFVEDAWHVVEPRQPFLANWHIDAIAEHLEAVARGEIRRLLVNIPPRHGKSLLVSVFWPVWSWTFRPSTRWMFASYRYDLAQRDALKSRRIIQSPWFRSEYGDRFRLTSDQNVKSRYENDRTGYRLAMSAAGGVTGEGGDFIVADDPHNVQKTESDTQRRSVIAWWDEAMSTRLNDPRTGAMVIVMQRIHEADLSGHVLEQGGYTHLCLPAVAERKTVVTVPPGVPLIEREEGDLLWPERVGPAEIAQAQRQMGPYAFAGQMQQSPMPRGGGMFKRDWWGSYDPRVLPRLRRVIQVLDSAFKEGVENDPSGLATWALDFAGNLYVLGFWKARVAYPDLMAAVHRLNGQARAKYGTVPLVIEDKASGQSAVQTLSRPYRLPDGTLLPRLTVLPFPDPASPLERDLAASSKEARAEHVTPHVASGRVLMPKPGTVEWDVEDFVSQHEKFPGVEHDEEVDTTAMALIRLAEQTPAPPPLPPSITLATG